MARPSSQCRLRTSTKTNVSSTRSTRSWTRRVAASSASTHRQVRLMRTSLVALVMSVPHYILGEHICCSQIKIEQEHCTQFHALKCHANSTLLVCETLAGIFMWGKFPLWRNSSISVPFPLCGKSAVAYLGSCKGGQIRSKLQSLGLSCYHVMAQQVIHTQKYHHTVLEFISL